MPIDKKRGDKTRFAQVPREVSKDQRLKLSDLRVLLFLLSHTENWHVRITFLANKLGMNERTVRESLKHLQALGYADPIMKQVGKQMQAVDWTIRAIPVERQAVASEGQVLPPGSTSPTPRASGPGTPRVHGAAAPGSADPGYPGSVDPPTKNELTQSEPTQTQITQVDLSQKLAAIANNDGLTSQEERECAEYAALANALLEPLKRAHERRELSLLAFKQEHGLIEQCDDPIQVQRAVEMVERGELDVDEWYENS